jgi:hypothetical protein
MNDGFKVVALALVGSVGVMSVVPTEGFCGRGDLCGIGNAEPPHTHEREPSAPRQAMRSIVVAGSTVTMQGAGYGTNFSVKG